MLLAAVGGVVILLIIAPVSALDLLWHGLAAAAFLVLSGLSALSLLSQDFHEELLEGALLVDPQGMAFHLIFVVVALLTVLSSINHLKAEGYAWGEYFGLQMIDG